MAASKFSILGKPSDIGVASCARLSTAHLLPWELLKWIGDLIKRGALMQLRVSAILFLALTALLAQPVAPIDSRGWINKGVQEYKAARYQDAVESFQKAVYLDPNNVTAHLYLATSLMSQYIPGAESPENMDIASKAAEEFNRVLQIDPNNTTALASMASLRYQQAQGMPDLDQKIRKLDEAASWYEKLIAADPQNKEAYYSLGVIDWVKWYAPYLRTRTDLGMRPEQPGPLPNPARQQLKTEYSSMIEHGISSLEKALQLDPRYSDAMAYMNLLIRERADLADSPEQYRSETELADQWVHKALDAKKAQAAAAQLAEPPPPPGQGAATPQRIRVGGNVQAVNLIQRVEPVYPPLALQARIQGIVRFTAIIGRDGAIQNLQLVSGHPLLVEAARQAASQWHYKPTLLNGEPVEVVTPVDVNFTLP
jgi:TonB family protein